MGSSGNDTYRLSLAAPYSIGPRALSTHTHIHTHLLPEHHTFDPPGHHLLATASLLTAHFLPLNLLSPCSAPLTLHCSIRSLLFTAHSSLPTFGTASFPQPHSSLLTPLAAHLTPFHSLTPHSCCSPPPFHSLTPQSYCSLPTFASSSCHSPVPHCCCPLADSSTLVPPTPGSRMKGTQGVCAWLWDPRAEGELAELIGA
eukprot:scaffold295420_cov22-Tisochrysis_lutea.AAC.1